MKERKIILTAAAAGFFLALGITARTYVYAESTQQNIADNVIRFHVLANSDQDSDQAVKLLVRDEILKKFKPGLSDSGSREATKAYLNAHLNEITACARAVIKEQGYGYPVTATVETAFFPTKAYGDVVFPPGEYEALRVVIGEGKGQNWWCVMFPPLCYVDLTQDIPAKEKARLSSVVADEGYSLLTRQEEDTDVKVKFKIVEWWQNRKAAN